MLKRIMLLVLVLLLCCPLAAIGAGEDELRPFGSDYVIGPGDLLDISHWQNASLTRTVTVLPDGRISFPLIGEVMAGGKTVAQLKGELEVKIARFVPDPVLSVIVQQVNSMQIYVIGKVNQPGRFVLNANVNVLQALSLAGGLNSFAKKNKINIFRQQGGDTTLFLFAYDDVVEGKNLDANISLKRGDVVVVP